MPASGGKAPWKTGKKALQAKGADFKVCHPCFYRVWNVQRSSQLGGGRDGGFLLGLPSPGVLRRAIYFRVNLLGRRDDGGLEC